MRMIVFWRITIMAGIPRIFRMLAKLEIPQFLRFLIPIRFAISGADALPGEIVTAFKEKFNIILLQGYGLTEAAPVVSLNPPQKQKRP